MYFAVKHIHSNQLAGRALYHTGLLAKNETSKTTIRNSNCLFIFTIICNRKGIKRPYLNLGVVILYWFYIVFTVLLWVTLYQQTNPVFHLYFTWKIRCWTLDASLDLLIATSWQPVFVFDQTEFIVWNL